MNQVDTQCILGSHIDLVLRVATGQPTWNDVALLLLAALLVAAAALQRTWEPETNNQ